MILAPDIISRLTYLLIELLYQRAIKTSPAVLPKGEGRGGGNSKFLTVDETCGRLDADLSSVAPDLQGGRLVEDWTTTAAHARVTRVADVTLQLSYSQ